ncbi:ankyrin repeat domain-containing protein [Escherichia coli]
MEGFYSDELPDFFSKPKNYHFKSKLNYYPITQAAFLGETEVVSNLIKLGVDLDVRGDLGRTALHEAVSNGYFDIVKLLVEIRSRSYYKGSIWENGIRIG